MDLAHFWNTSGAYEIKQSLRFNSADSANLSKSFTASASCTFSFWVKRANLGAEQYLFWCDGGAGNHWGLRYDGDDKFTISKTQSGADTATTSTAVYRDVSGWYHIVVNGTPTFYVNGVQVATGSYTWAHIGGTAYIGRRSSTYLNAYLAEFNYIDGSNLTPSSFGETDTITGAWIPKKYSGSYGTNGFYLKFEGSGIGTDSSGNGNNFTATGFSTSGTGTDVMSDTPTNNWCTLNPLDTHAVAALTDGNLAITGQSASKNGLGTIAVNNGKWYYEAQYTTAPSTNSGIGVATIGTWSNMSDMDSNPSGIRYRDNGVIYQNGASQGTFASYTTNDIIGVAFDCDTGQISFYKNNTLQTTLTGVTALQNNSITACLYNYAGNMAVNFGQRGAFAYTPPTGFKALNTANLPEPTIKKGGAHFNTVLWTGDGSQTRSLTGVGFQSDFTWIKSRSVTQEHQLYDAVRGAGAGKMLCSNQTAQEGQDGSGNSDSQYGYISSFDTDGFSLNDGTVATTGGWVNFSGRTYVGWNWKANGAGSSNTAGTITSTVSANATAGFSIVTYTGTGNAATVGHGLGVAPSMIIEKNRDRDQNWAVYHSALGATKALILDDSLSAQTATYYWNDTAPTSTVFSIGTWNGVNSNGEKHVAYCFSEVAGYSKFGSYTGNGSSDGPFVFCGFRPRWVLIKSTTVVSDWEIKDSARDARNPAEARLFPDVASQELTGTPIDLLSNGFKLRQGTDLTTNQAGATYIFAAFAEHPFKYANAR